MSRKILLVIAILWSCLVSTARAQEICPLDNLKPRKVKSLESLNHVAILDQGRIKPFETYAKNFLLQLSGREHYQKENATQWMARFLFAPRTTFDDKIFLINHPEILEALKSPPKPSGEEFSGEDMDGMKSLGAEQGSLSSETGKLGQEISKLGSKSALVKPETLDSIKSAQEEMRKSAKSLSKGESGEAVAAQEKALSYLRKGQSSMSETGRSLGKMKEMRGQKQAGMVQRRDGKNGSSGFRRGVVKIPGAQDYLPPKEFREEILESLKEKYPKSEESLIKDYFKRLTQ